MATGSMTSLTLETLPRTDPRREEALRLIVTCRGESPRAADRRIRRLLAYVDAEPVRQTVVLGATVAGRLVTASLLVGSPGRLGAVFLPRHVAHGLQHQALIQVLEAVQNAAWALGFDLLQVLLEAEEREQGLVLERAGFSSLAELVYMERSAYESCPTFEPPPGVEFVSLTSAPEELFLAVLDQTYRASLDCPRLAGVRRTADVLATHRATGRHDPAYWWVARVADRPLGILLLAGLADRAAFEIVYIGVVPEARGQGVGDLLLERAVQVCRRNHNAGLNLAVDRENQPARRLYRRWSFREVNRRRAWFCARPADLGVRSGPGKD